MSVYRASYVSIIYMLKTGFHFLSKKTSTLFHTIVHVAHSQAMGFHHVILHHHSFNHIIYHNFLKSSWSYFINFLLFPLVRDDNCHKHIAIQLSLNNQHLLTNFRCQCVYYSKLFETFKSVWTYHVNLQLSVRLDWIPKYPMKSHYVSMTKYLHRNLYNSWSFSANLLSSHTSLLTCGNLILDVISNKGFVLLTKIS